MVEPVFLYPLVEHLIGFGQVSELTTLQHLLTRYRTTEKNYLEENTLKTMGPDDSAELLALLIEQLEKRREFAREGGQKILMQ